MRIIDQLFEWELLIFVGTERPILHLGKQRSKGFIGFDTDTKHLNIHEETDQLFRVLVPIGTRRSNNDVPLASHSVKKRAKYTEQQNIQRYILIFAKLMGSRGELRGDKKCLDVS